jgi:hypothetical protein
LHIELPAHVQCLARDKFRVWKRDPFQPSMQSSRFAPKVWSMRISDHDRALARREGELVVWFWIGTHKEYNKFLKHMR